MLHRVFNAFLAVIVSLLLASCVAIDQMERDVEQIEQAVGIQKFPAWSDETLSSGSTGKGKAIKQLLGQADTLIATNQMEQASDKLERLLRIEPSYAQAWSRLAWIALENNMPGRSQQMAQRSNSYAYQNNRLQALNWSFIREAGFQKGDEEIIRQAETMIRTLDNAWGNY